MCLFAYLFTKLDNIANSLVGGGDDASGLGLALATAQIAKMTYAAMRGGTKGGGGAGGRIENNSRFSTDLDKGVPLAGQGTQTVGQGVRHSAHTIAARYRNS
jgi:hypothetical protein